MVDLPLILYTAIGTAVLAAIALIGSNWSTIVSSISAWNEAMIAHGRAQRERRARVYGYAAEPVLGDNRTGSIGGSAGSGDLVRGQQHQAELGEPLENEPGRSSPLRQLSKDELIVMLAVQRKDDGSYVWSANQITSFVGGAAAPVKDVIANVRGRKEAPKNGAPLRRPASGW